MNTVDSCFAWVFSFLFFRDRTQNDLPSDVCKIVSTDLYSGDMCLTEVNVEILSLNQAPGLKVSWMVHQTARTREFVG